MKIQSKINLYNILTIVFAVFTVISLGSFGQMPFIRVAINVAVFAMLTRQCFINENKLRRILRNRRRASARRAQLSVFRGNGGATRKVNVA